jgi:D-beta-D-heptose 7-phosphate kinase/D-beta-D-heptose 1-phosphate adenosyltransferase
MIPKIVWINGCFDILHYGHFKLIEYAGSFGSKLIIGIDSDERVKQLKGNDRPFHNQIQREYNLRQIKGVMDVIVFNTEDELRSILQNLNPDYFVIGDDYIDKPIIGGNYAKEIKFFEKFDEFSTTKILKNKK